MAMEFHPDVSSEPPTTELLLEARAGRREAADALFERLYHELRSIARIRLRGHRPGATLDTTGLVHEAYLRLVNLSQVTPEDRAHFLALASRAMRFVLLDLARARGRHKRGGGRPDVPLDTVQIAAEERAEDLLSLDRALDDLRAHSGRLADVVEYRFFGGLTYREMSTVTGRSVATVERDWARARTWLYRAMRDAAREGG
jgi:RNA polymerase sigma factor (TIGR02999 family)